MYFVPARAATCVESTATNGSTTYLNTAGVQQHTSLHFLVRPQEPSDRLGFLVPSRSRLERAEREGLLNNRDMFVLLSEWPSINLVA